MPIPLTPLTPTSIPPDIPNPIQENSTFLIDNERQIVEQFSKLNEFISQGKLLKRKLRHSPEVSLILRILLLIEYLLKILFN